MRQSKIFSCFLWLSVIIIIKHTFQKVIVIDTRIVIYNHLIHRYPIQFYRFPVCYVSYGKHRTRVHQYHFFQVIAQAVCKAANYLPLLGYLNFCLITSAFFSASLCNKGKTFKCRRVIQLDVCTVFILSDTNIIFG